MGTGYRPPRTAPPGRSRPVRPPYPAGVNDFDVSRLPDEHEMVREAGRAVCDDKIAPLAAEVDVLAEFPQESYDALRKADFHAVHIPEQYGGAGGRAAGHAAG